MTIFFLFWSTLLTVAAPANSCPDGQHQVTVDWNSGSYADEVRWEVVQFGQTVVSGQVGGVTTGACLYPGLAQVKGRDTYGDSWNGFELRIVGVYYQQRTPKQSLEKCYRNLYATEQSLL